MDDFFARPIRLENPKPPLHGSEYVANWPEFHEFLTRQEALYSHGLDPCAISFLVESLEPYKSKRGGTPMISPG
ncbi:hypothetical protein [Methylomagnum sp.]